MFSLRAVLVSLLATASIFPSAAALDVCNPHDVPWCGYYYHTNPRLVFYVYPDNTLTVSVNGSTTTWGAHKALGYNLLRMEAETPAPNMEVRMMFKEPPIKRGWGMPLLERYLSMTGMAGLYPPVQPKALIDFINTFEPGQGNHDRVQSWLGQRRAPRKGEATRLHPGGPEIVVQSGQIVDVRADTTIRFEMDATMQAWSDGTVVQCIGRCTEKSVQWSATMKNGDMKAFSIAPETEFLEINFINAMRIIVQTNRDYVIYPPRNIPVVTENRIFLQNENLNLDAWAKLPQGYMEGGVRMCEQGREYEGEPSDRRSAKACQMPSILRFHDWNPEGDGPIMEPLPPRPLTTVSDFAKEFFEYQAARDKKVRRAKAIASTILSH